MAIYEFAPAGVIARASQPHPNGPAGRSVSDHPDRTVRLRALCATNRPQASAHGADYAALIGQGAVWIAAQEGHITGFLVAYHRPPSLFVETVAIDPDRQGTGLGRAFMQFAEEHAAREGMPSVALYTNAAMHENVAFYTQLGYTLTDQRTEDGYQRIYFAKAL